MVVIILPFYMFLLIQEYEIRNEQVKHRAQEMIRCLDLISDLQSGNLISNQNNTNISNLDKITEYQWLQNFV